MSQRFHELQSELAKVFGRYTKWQVRCQEQHATTEEQQMKVAEEVLAEPCSGSVAEARTHWLGLEGVETMTIDDFLGRKQKNSRP